MKYSAGPGRTSACDWRNRYIKKTASPADGWLPMMGSIVRQFAAPCPDSCHPRTTLTTSASSGTHSARRSSTVAPGCGSPQCVSGKATGWRPQDMAGQWVLDVGCGAGRFAEIALEAGARVLALDYSSAVDACYANLKHHPHLHVVQGDIYCLPLADAQFPFVYSLGVLQHTPDVARAFAALPRMAAPGGRICVDFYWKRLRSILHGKYVLRPLTKRVPQEALFRFLRSLCKRSCRSASCSAGFLLRGGSCGAQFPLRTTPACTR